MKKIFAAFAASAVAVSMLAFAGCDDPKTADQGVIPGDYEDKTSAEEITESVGDLNTDNLFGEKEENGETVTTVNVGIRANLDGGITVGELMNASGKISMDYKEMIADKGPIGIGTATVNATYKSPDMKEAATIDVTGKLYNDNDVVYGEANGTIPGVDLGKDGVKVQINVLKLVEALEGADDDTSTSTASFLAADSATINDISLTDLLVMAQQFGVKVAIDNKDGVKIKLSVVEDTIWTAYTVTATEAGMSPTEIAENITAIKGKVTFNAFKFDVYFAVDKDGKFSGASTVMDIDIKTDTGIKDIFDKEEDKKDLSTPSTTAEVTPDAVMDINVKLKGSIELYTHTDKVEIPASLATDESYADMTDTLIALIKESM